MKIRDEDVVQVLTVEGIHLDRLLALDNGLVGYFDDTSRLMMTIIEDDALAAAAVKFLQRRGQVQEQCLFGVDEAHPGGVFTGRNGYVELPLGTVFKSLRKVKFEGARVDLRRIDLGVVAEMSLRLEKVEVFRRPMEFIPRGYTARLYLSGDGVELVRLALADLQERESLSLHPY